MAPAATLRQVRDESRQLLEQLQRELDEERRGPFGHA
jgi:hypothetical protein